MSTVVVRQIQQIVLVVKLVRVRAGRNIVILGQVSVVGVVALEQ
jgi:hypothetical protein